MGRSKIKPTLLIIVLMLSANYAKSEELTPNMPDSINSTQNSAQAIDVESFRKELQQASSNPADLSSNNIKGRVKTLDTKYMLAPGDTFSISVYGEPDFSQPEILVRPDGYATIEPFGEMDVAGVDVDTLTTTLKDKFKTYLLDPRISVKVNNLQTAKVYIYGAVQKPGLYQQQSVSNTVNTTGRSATVYPDLTVASVIANAGGVVYNADLRHVKITNNVTGRNQEIDLMRMLEAGDVSQDIFLRSGDSIHVPYLETSAQIPDKDFMLISSSSLAPLEFPVRVIGAVNMPGVVKLTSGSPRLNSAIAASQGYSPFANRKVVTVQRITSQGNVSTFFVEPDKNDLILRPNDTVMIMDKSTSVAGRGFDFLTTVLSPFGRFADSYNGWAEMFNPGRRYNNY